MIRLGFKYIKKEDIRQYADLLAMYLIHTPHVG